MRACVWGEGVSAEASPRAPSAAPAAPAAAAADAVGDAGLASALQHRDTLLEYQRNSSQRTRVLDDVDLHAEANSVWLSAEERQVAAAAAARRTAAMTQRRATTRVTLDFAGHAGVRVLDDDAAEEQAAYENLHAASAPAAAGAGAGARLGAARAAADAASSPPPPLSPSAAATVSPGSGYFTNTTLHGRAAAIYAGMREHLAADGGAAS